jgi:UDP-N-acetylglucosamine 2-epimerase (non-hydrolysing)
LGDKAIMTPTSKLKVMTVVGTRPEIIKLSRVIPLLDEHTRHVLVHSGQNYDYELNEVFFKELGLRRPDHFLEVAGGSVAEVISAVISRADRVMEQEKPDALLLYGDTNTCLCVIAAKRRKIPVFHMEAGNRCFDQRVPEELNRKVVDHLSDINLPLTEHARRYLLDEGIAPETIIKTGSTMPEVLAFHRAAIGASSVLQQLQLAAGKYLLVSLHREENVDAPERLSAILEALRLLVDSYDVPAVVSTHPRTRQRLAELGGSNPVLSDPRVTFLKPFGFLDYVKLQQNALCVISDSGTITEEAAILGFPAVTLREAHERPEGMDAGTLIMCSLKADRLFDAVRIATRTGRPLPRVPDYEDTNVSDKVLHVILSYVDYVNRTVWRRT